MRNQPRMTWDSDCMGTQDDKLMLGTVKFFLVKDGYGFITPDGVDADSQKEDRFFHHSQLNVPRLSGSTGNKYKSISQGTKVSFIPVENDKGLAAMNVTPI